MHEDDVCNMLKEGFVPETAKVARSRYIKSHIWPSLKKKPKLTLEYVIQNSMQFDMEMGLEQIENAQGPKQGTHQGLSL